MKVLKAINRFLNEHIGIVLLIMFTVSILIYFDKNISVTAGDISVKIESDGQEVIVSMQEAYEKMEKENKEMKKNLAFPAVFDIRKIPAKKVSDFMNHVKEVTGSLYVPMFGYNFPYGFNQRFPLTFNTETFEWVYDVENRDLITFVNMRFSHNIIGQNFEEENPPWAQMGEKYNCVIPGMIGKIVTSHWAVILDYIPEGLAKKEMDNKIATLRAEWEELLIKHNPDVLNLNYVFSSDRE